MFEAFALVTEVADVPTRRKLRKTNLISTGTTRTRSEDERLSRNSSHFKVHDQPSKMQSKWGPSHHLSMALEVRRKWPSRAASGGRKPFAGLEKFAVCRACEGFPLLYAFARGIAVVADRVATHELDGFANRLPVLHGFKDEVRDLVA
jgi:hypothetical protein